MLNQPPAGNSSHLLQRTDNDATRYLLPVLAAIATLPAT